MFTQARHRYKKFQNRGKNEEKVEKEEIMEKKKWLGDSEEIQMMILKKKDQKDWKEREKKDQKEKKKRKKKK